ncbi:MAG: GNAT family N-acetyltransferase [Candidatus Bathyarchaeota archaeon]|nr:MAG: GNAT family N-acetyltransferase [Candidatus Bathyarchaeota archaeon]
MDFNFEPLQEKDVDSCVKMIISTLGSQAKEYGDKNRLKGMIYGKQVMTLVAKREKKIVGLITATLLGFPRILFLTVAEKKSALAGLGGQLIDQLVKEIKKNTPHMKQILHNEFADNFNAVGLYSIKGFTIAGYMKDPLTNRDVVFMKKDI